MAKTKAKFKWRLILLPLPLLWAFLSQQGHLAVLDNLLLDYRFQARGEVDAPVKVIYVDIDSQSIDELGNFPWPRAYFAQVGGALIDTGRAKAVGVDIVFSEKGVSESYDRARWVETNVALARYLRGNPPMVVAASYAAREYREVTGKREVRDFPMLRDGIPADLNKVALPELPEFNIGRGIMWNPPRVGLIDTLGGGTRWVPLFAPTGLKRYDHMAFSLALLYWGVDPKTVKITPEAIEIPRPDGSLAMRIPLTDQQLVEINWFSPWLSPKNPRIGFSTVFNYTRMLTAEDEKVRANAQGFFKQFNDAIILIGPVDKLLQDLAPTPMDEDPVPKVGVHGNLLKTIVSGQFLHRLPIWALYVLTFTLTVVVTELAMAGGARGLFSKGAALLVLVGFVGLGFLLFQTNEWVIPMAAPLASALSTAFAGVIWQLIVEEKAKGRIKSMFGTYLAPELVNQMVESEADPQLGGHEDVITAYFSDIQSFSTFSELMPASQLVELMNEYLSACTDIVQEEKGTLDKYIGDAVVAIFNAPVPVPDHAYRACVAAIRVQDGIEQLRQKWRGEGEKWPKIVHHLRARLGLNTGTAIIGNMGSRTRFSYTMMGDNVNLAARMESGAKLLGVYTMVTEATKLECEKQGGDKIVFRFLDRIVVKGRSLPVPVYEVVGFRDKVGAPVLECLRLHAQATERYLAQDWDAAVRLFQQSAVLEPYQPNKAQFIESNPSLIMSERCHYWMNHPPGEKWDGVFTMKEKG